MRHITTLLLLLCIATSLIGQQYEGPQEDIDAILSQAASFSRYFVHGDMDSIVSIYTEEAKIFPTGKDIMSGTAALTTYWTRSPEVKALHHKLTPLEIIITGDRATDYGYYEGKTQYKEQPVSSWKGKYLVVWKKVNDTWKMDLDIWNKIETPTPLTADQEAVRAACLDYIDAFYKADTTLAIRSVDPSLRKAGYYYDQEQKTYTDRLEMPYSELLNLAGSWNAKGDKEVKTAPRAVRLFEVTDKTAAAKVTALWGIDYLSLAKIDGTWKIINVLWQSAPR